MDDRDYEKLLAQVMRLEGGWLAPYCDPAGNLIVAADPSGEQASIDRKRMTLRESHLRRVALDLEDIIPVVGRLDAVGSMYFPQVRRSRACRRPGKYKAAAFSRS